MKLECIKGFANDETLVCLQGDIVAWNGNDDNGDIELEGLEGWCEGLILIFSPQMVVDHFKVKFDQAKLNIYIYLNKIIWTNYHYLTD